MAEAAAAVAAEAVAAAAFEVGVFEVAARSLPRDPSAPLALGSGG